MERYLEICVEIKLKQCWRLCLEFCVGVVAKNTKKAKAKKSRNAKKDAGKVLREEG